MISTIILLSIGMLFGVGLLFVTVPLHILEASLIATKLKILLSDEGDSITFTSDNPDFGGPNTIVICCGSWTDWKDLPFSGDNRIECLKDAVEKKLATEKVSLGDG